jgi:hypothetical protein
MGTGLGTRAGLRERAVREWVRDRFLLAFNNPAPMVRVHGTYTGFIRAGAEYLEKGLPINAAYLDTQQMPHSLENSHGALNNRNGIGRSMCKE